MSRVDFAYGASHGLTMACHTAARHVNAGHLLHVYCSDANRLARFNLKLWDFEPTSFISHCMIDDPLASHAQVLLLHQEAHFDLVKQPQWLLNLDLACPPKPNLFERILEIVSNQEKDKEHARARWQEYKKLGLTLKGHKLNRD